MASNRTVAAVRLAVVLAAATCHVTSAQNTMPSIFVGPQIRDGFVDIDAGIRDSIRDIREELSWSRWRIASSREDATMVLIVVARGIVTNGSVGFSSIGSGFGWVVPNNKPTVTTILRVGTYEKVMQSEGGTWREAAGAVVNDVMAWWKANETAVRARQ